MERFPIVIVKEGNEAAVLFELNILTIPFYISYKGSHSHTVIHRHYHENTHLTIKAI